MSIGLGFLLLIVLSGYLVVERKQRLLSSLIEQQFVSQKEHLQLLEQTLKTSQRLLSQGSDIIAQHMLLNPSSQRESSFEFAVSDRVKQVYQLDLLQPSRILGVTQETQQPDVNLLLNHYDVIESVLSSITKNEFVAGVAFVNKGEGTLFTYSKAGNFDSPASLFNWMQHNKTLLQASYDHRDLLYAPPILEPIKNERLSYILFPVSISSNNQQFIVVRLKGRMLIEVESRKEGIQYVSWHQKSGLAIASNVIPPSTSGSRSHDFLATRYLPEVLHPYARSAKKSVLFKPDLHMVEARLGPEDKLAPWVVYYQAIISSPYRFVYFKPGQAIVDAAFKEALAEVAVYFLAGLFVLFSVLWVVIWKLAVPTSKLIFHIEQQSSLYEIDNKIFVPGWEKWFEKVSLSFSDNRKLLKSLLNKNKQLDSKVQQRTLELQKQTNYKDRNIALNRAIINSIPDMIYFKNLDGGYLGCNSAFEQFAGLNEAEIAALQPEEVFSKEDAEELTRFDFQALKSKRAFNGTSWHILSNGANVLINWLVAPIIDREGEVLGLLGVGKDITEQEASLKEIERARHEAERANEAKSEFIANMSHEIRTPMNAIMGMLELMQSASPSALQQSYLTVAESSSQHLLNIINDILDFSKVNANKLELHYDVFGLSEIFDISFANSLPSAMRKGLLLDIDIPVDFPEYFIGDLVRLNQVFTNLIGNAVKFTEEGQVTLKVRCLGRINNIYQLEFELKDTGVGIPEEKQKGVFEAFTQADTSVTRKFGGTGLGLTIVYQLVKLMGGTTTLSSEVGQGTRFTIALSLEAVSEQPDYEKIQRKWLVYEPNEQYRKVLVDKLTQAEQDFRVLDLEQDEKLCLQANEILICQPDLLTLLPSSEVVKIKQGVGHLQPVVFSISQFSTDFIHDLPYYPILTIPFSVHALLFNQFQHQIAEANEHLLVSKPLRNTRVLVIEDNDINQQVVKLMLTEEGASVATAENGKEGLEKLERDSYDAIILDVQMPIMDGLTCAKRIRQLPNHASLPIIAMTAHNSAVDKEKSRLAGINVHLTKPVEKKALINVLSQLSADDNRSDSLPKKNEKVVNKEFNRNTDLLSLAELIDLNFLNRQFNHNPNTIRTLLTRFHQSKNDEILELLQTAKEMERQQLLAKLHNIKGMLGSLGAEQLHRLTAQIELALKEGEFPDTAFTNWSQQLKTLMKKIESLET